VKFTSTLRAQTRVPILQVLKTSVAAIVAWLLSDLLLGQPLPIFAAIAALLVVQPSVSQTLTRGIERSVGVIAGVTLAVVIGQVFGNAGWVVLVVIVIALLVGWVLRLGPGSANQIPISAMLVLAIGAQTPGYAVDRIIETIIGAAVGLIVNLAIVPPVVLQPAHLAVGRLLRDVATVMDQLALSLRTPQTRQQLDDLLASARALREVRDTAEAALARGAESLMMNPRRSKLRRVLHRDEVLFERLKSLVIRMLGMARAIHDRYDPALTREPTVASIATELERAAHDLRLVGRDPEGSEPDTVTAEQPALTQPLSVLVPHAEHWVLIGSLLEDLRRVREEIIGSTDG